MELGFIAAFGFVVLLIVGIYCFGYASRKTSLLYILLLETIFGLVIIIPLLFIESGLHIRELILLPNTNNYIWLAIAALLGFTGGNYFSLLNLKTAGEKINSLLSPAITASTVLISYFVFSEYLNIKQWIGILITLTVIICFLLATVKNHKSANAISNTGWWSSVATIVCISLSIISSIKGATDTISFLHAITIRLFFAFLIVFIAFLITKEYQKIDKQPYTFYVVIIIGILAQTIGASYLWYYATFSIGIAIVQIIIASLPIWVYAVDIYVLRKSKPSISFILASLLAGLGIYLVMY